MCRPTAGVRACFTPISAFPGGGAGLGAAGRQRCGGCVRSPTAGDSPARNGPARVSFTGLPLPSFPPRTFSRSGCIYSLMEKELPLWVPVIRTEPLAPSGPSLTTDSAWLALGGEAAGRTGPPQPLWGSRSPKRPLHLCPNTVHRCAHRTELCGRVCGQGQHRPASHCAGHGMACVLGAARRNRRGPRFWSR